MLTETLIQASIDKMQAMRKSLEEEREKVQVLEDLITHIQHRIYVTKEFSANTPANYVSCVDSIEGYVASYLKSKK